ncbi:hypothetical protein BH11PSE12_BH11PSE12_27540 [soil metagenome]
MSIIWNKISRKYCIYIYFFIMHIERVNYLSYKNAMIPLQERLMITRIVFSIQNTINNRA